MRPHTLRVMSLNLWNDRGDVTQRLQAALAAIKLLDVDAIGLQEVREVHGGLRQAQQIATALDARSIFAAADARSPSGAIGNAVVSRLPMRLLGETMLPADGRDPRVALAVELQTPYGAFCFVTTHLTWELEASPIRERQVVALDAFTRPFARSLPSVMTGDFNASPDTDAIRFLTGRKSLDGQGTYWRDAWARIHPHDDGYTWSARNPQVVRLVERNRRIDYIFVGPLADDRRGAILDARVVLDQPDKDGVFPSDHFGVFAEIALEPVEEPR